MLAALRERRTPRRTVVATALYALFLVTAPFEHHDILCHLKSPQHCTACASSLVSSAPGAFAAPGAATLADAGGATTTVTIVSGFLLAVRTTGRSPPAA